MRKSNRNADSGGLMRHPLFVGIVSAVLGAAVGGFVSPYIMVDRYVDEADIDKYIELSLVKTGYVESGILDLETYSGKMDMIRETFDDYSDTVVVALTNLGVSESSVSGMTEGQRLIKLQDKTDEVYRLYLQTSAELENAASENDNLKEELEARVDASVMETTLVIDGETMNEGNAIPNAVALIDGNYYYSGGLLSTYLLSKQLVFDKTASNLVYGNAKPEKVALSWDGMVTNSSNASYYAIGGESFNMASKAYDIGVVFTNAGSYYIHLNGEYSSMSFVCGHIDNSEQVDATLSIYQISDDNLSYDRELASFSLTGEMIPNEYTVDLNYTGSIKVVITGSNYRTQYGMSDIYFYK